MAEIKSKPGRPTNGLPTPAHVLECLLRYESKGDLKESMNLSEIKNELNRQIVFDQLNKKEKMRNYMKEYIDKGGSNE